MTTTSNVCLFSKLSIVLEASAIKDVKEAFTIKVIEQICLDSNNSSLKSMHDDSHWFYLTAYQYIIKTGGLDSEKSYPYEGRDGQCRFNPASIAATIKGNLEFLKFFIA